MEIRKTFSPITKQIEQSETEQPNNQDSKPAMLKDGGIAAIADSIETPKLLDSLSAALQNSASELPDAPNEFGRQFNESPIDTNQVPKPGASGQTTASDSSADGGSESTASFSGTIASSVIAEKFGGQFERVDINYPPSPNAGGANDVSSLLDLQRGNDAADSFLPSKDPNAPRSGGRAVDAYLANFTPSIESRGEGYFQDMQSAVGAGWKKTGDYTVGNTTHTFYEKRTNSDGSTSSRTAETRDFGDGGSWEIITEKTEIYGKEVESTVHKKETDANGNVKISTTTTKVEKDGSKTESSQSYEKKTESNPDGSTTTTETTSTTDSSGQSTTTTTTTTTPKGGGVEQPVEEETVVIDKSIPGVDTMDPRQYLREITGHAGGPTGGEKINPGPEGNVYAGGSVDAQRVVDYTKENLLGGDGADDIPKGEGGSPNPYATQDGGATDPEENNI